MAKILIVEDDILVSKSICECLTAEKYLVETAGSGEDALQLLNNFEYEIVLLDWSLPGIWSLLSPE